jgi:calpain-15
LANGWFISAVAILAERPALIERLFLSKEVNVNGIYRLKICKNGEWQVITIDDLIPCFPMDEPLFSKCHGNEIWMMLLEKAYAKLHGSYYLLRGGSTFDALLDLSGCPTESYDFKDPYVAEQIKKETLWKMIKFLDDQGYLLSVSSHGEQRWEDNETPPIQVPNSQGVNKIPNGYAFAIVVVRELPDGSKLINFRDPLKKVEWDGEWGPKSHKWTD